MKTLYSLVGFEAALEPGPLNDLLDRLFGDVFDFIEITDFFESEENGVRSYTLVLAVEQSIFFTVPGLDALTLGVIRDSEDVWPLILCELVVEGAPQQLTIRHFPLRVGIDNPYLLPVPPEDEADALDGFTFEVEGSISVNTALDLRAELESFSLPPFTISGTGLVLGLEACSIITSEEDVDSDITDLGFNNSFRGIYAASAQFYWDIPFQIDGMELPGLRANLNKLAIGNQGLSVEASLTWNVQQDGQQFVADQTELLGSLFDSGWQFALEQLNVVIQANNPIGTSASGYLRIPFLNTIIKAELGYRYESENVYRYNAKLTQKDNSAVSIPLGNTDYVLEIQDFLFEGQFETNGKFSFSGHCRLTLSLPGLNFQGESVEIEFEHKSEQDNLLIKLENITVEGFGEIEQAQLVLVFVKDDQGQYELTIFELMVDLQWQDISDRIQLGQQADFLPLPADDAEISLGISWQEDNTHFTLQAELDDVDQLWRFIPENIRPEVDDATIDIKLTSSSSNGNSDFEGEISLGFLLRLPELATLAPLQAAGLSQMIALDTGNDEGWIQLQFKAELESPDDDSGSGNAGKISASLENPVALTLQLPGLMLPEPPVHVSIDTIGINLATDGDDLSGVFELKGDFQLHPVLPDNLNGFVPPVIAQQLNQLLAIAGQVDLSGEASLTLGFSADNAYFKTECIFDNAELELDLFDMLSNALSGGANLLGTEDSGTEIDLDIDVSVGLKKISLSVGSEEREANQPVPFVFSMTTVLGFAGQQAEMGFELSNDSLSFGFNELTIPVAIPKLPMNLSDLDRLKDANNAWDYDNNWLGLIEPEINAEINRLDQELEQARDSLQELQENGADENAIFQLEFRQIPDKQKALFQYAGRKFLYEAVLAIHQMLGNAGVAGSQLTYQQGIETYQGAVDAVFGSLHFDTQMQFKISDAKFVLPFNNPSDIRVEGGASIIGFAPGDPLAALGDVVFKLGISADAIYFAVEGGAEPVPLPDFGRYPGSAINLDRLIIGYGYSKNSLKIDFSGELILSEQLIEDADSSAELGFGVRLPVNNKLQFKLDLIPVVLGEVDFLIPLVAFDIDLRSDSPPPPPPMDGQCRPAWDGLQLIVPEVVRADIKRYKMSPFFGPMPAMNVLYSFDIEAGNKDYGVSYICTDYFYISPLLYTIPIPFLADTSPFFNRFCINLRLGGFGLSFDLTRPFPSPSPLLIFELMGFISDPSVPIDPNGHIANLMYAQLYNARITLPPPVQTMFPSLVGVVSEDFSGKINIATVIALVQQIQGLADQLVNRLEDNTLQGMDWIQNITSNPPELSLKSALELLPDELRKLELDGRFVFFDASVTFVLALAKDVADQLGEDDTPALPKPPSTVYELTYQNNFNNNDLNGWETFDFGLKKGKGEWQIKHNRLLQDNNVGDNSPARYGAMLVHTGIEHSNLRLLVDATSSDNDGLGLVFHVQAKDTFYRFRMTGEQQQWSLVKLVKGRVSTLFETKDSFSKNTPYQIRIEASSRQSQSRGLNHKLSASRIKTKDRHLRDIGMDKIASRINNDITMTHIKVWVNGQLWCDVEDNKNALSKGHIGMDSWWNSGASFDNLEVYKKINPELSIGQMVATSQLQPLANNLSSGGSELAEVFTGFTAQDIAVAMAEAGEFSVALTARVKVYSNLVFKMLGAMGSDGNFLLMTSTDIDPVTLNIAGIDLPLEVDVQGRMTLRGKSAGADSYAKIEASVYGDWTLLPGSNPDNAVARLILANEAEPASLTLSSNPDFELQGSGELLLFAQQIIMTGDVDISQSHVMIAGELEFKPDITLFTGTRVMELSMSCNGRVGPGAFIELEGEGNLKLMGKQFTSLSARVTNQLLEISASLGGRNQGWQLGPIELNKVEMQLSGRVRFNQSSPAFAFNGEGKFGLFGATVEGNCRIEANNQYWLLANSGKLFWQGRNWLDGAIVLSNEGVQLSGKADFGLDLTPNQLPGSINIAGLHLNAAVSGQFSLNNQGQLRNWKFDLDWQLSIKLPGTDSSQALPIATQHFEVSDSRNGNDELIELFDLINIENLTLFDLGNITLPIPTVDLDNGEGIYLHDSVSIDPDGDGFDLDIPTPFPPNLGAPPDGNIVGLPFWNYTVGSDLPSLELPVPVLSNEAQNTGDNPLFKIPTFGTTDVTVPLGQLQLENVNFHLKLAWKKDENNPNDQLGILVKGQGGNGDKFIPFETSSFLMIGIGIVTDSLRL